MTNRVYLSQKKTKNLLVNVGPELCESKNLALLFRGLAYTNYLLVLLAPYNKPPSAHFT